VRGYNTIEKKFYCDPGRYYKMVLMGFVEVINWEYGGGFGKFGDFPVVLEALLYRLLFLTFIFVRVLLT
jgi:hypothetical protein